MLIDKNLKCVNLKIKNWKSSSVKKDGTVKYMPSWKGGQLVESGNLCSSGSHTCCCSEQDASWWSRKLGFIPNQGKDFLFIMSIPALGNHQATRSSFYGVKCPRHKINDSLPFSTRLRLCEALSSLTQIYLCWHI